MTGEQVPAPSSPRDGEDVAITIGQPKVYAGFITFSPVCWGMLCFDRIGSFIQQPQIKA